MDFCKKQYITIYSPVLTKFDRFWTKFGRFFVPFQRICVFPGFYEVRTSQLKACCKNSKFYRGVYKAAHKIDENSDNISEFPSTFTDFHGKIILRDYFLRKSINSKKPLTDCHKKQLRCVIPNGSFQRHVGVQIKQAFFDGCCADKLILLKNLFNFQKNICKNNDF